MDDKGRLQIPKEIRDQLGLKPGKVKGRIEGETLVIEPSSNMFDKLASYVKCNFDSLETSLPELRKSAEKQGLNEVKR